MDEYTGVCISDSNISNELLLHLLWADDLIMVSAAAKDTQRQLDGLARFSFKNQTSVNGIKTKITVFGKDINVTFNYRGMPIEQVTKYKYVGNIVNSILKPSSDIFSQNYDYLCDRARKASFALTKRINRFGNIPPICRLHLFESCIQPILLFGSEVWGASKTGREKVDKIFLRFLRTVLGVKATTSNAITLGECGMIPSPVGPCTGAEHASARDR